MLESLKLAKQYTVIFLTTILSLLQLLKAGPLPLLRRYLQARAERRERRRQMREVLLIRDRLFEELAAIDNELIEMHNQVKAHRAVLNNLYRRIIKP